MGRFAAGQIAVLPFPFSDLSGNKYRPALSLVDAGRGDRIPGLPRPQQAVVVDSTRT